MSDTAKSFKDIASDLRRVRILEAAVTVFGEYGFRGASMKEIAKQAGVSEGTIYNVFEDKLDLLVSLLDPLAQKTLPEGEVVKAAPADAIVERLAVFDATTLGMTRVLLSESLIDAEVRDLFGERIIGPMQGKKTNGTAYGALALVLGCVVLRLLERSDGRAEKQAIKLFAELQPARGSRS